MWQCALVLSIISAVSSQVVIDDSVVPRAKESDLSLILRNFDNKIKGMLVSSTYQNTALFLVYWCMSVYLVTKITSTTVKNVVIHSLPCEYS